MGQRTLLGTWTWVDLVADVVDGLSEFYGIQISQSRPVDDDGSGKAKLYAAQTLTDQQGTFGIYHIFQWDAAAGMLVSTGNGIAAEMDQQGNGDPYLGTIDFGDTTGRGLPDLFYQHFVTEKHPTWWLMKNDGSGGFGSVTDTGVDAYCGRSSRILDRDGDGKAEIWSGSNISCLASHVMGFDAGNQPVVDDQPGLPFDAKRIIFADLNGDGYREILKPQPGGGWVRFSTGVGYGPKENMVDGPVPDGNVSEGMDQGAVVIDMNGDGREDILAFHDSPSPMIIAHLSLGDGSFLPITLNIWPGWPSALEGFTTSRTGDFNGDSLMDIGKIDVDGHMRVLLQKPGQVDVVHAVWNFPIAEHAREVIEYSNAWSDSPKPATCAYPQQCIKHGFPVVREHKILAGEGVGQYRTTHYSFEDPRVDVRGRGYLGFGEMRVWDVERLSETRVTFDNKTRLSTIYPYAGLATKVVQITPILDSAPAALPTSAIARVSQVENTYGIEVQNFFQTHFVHPASWTSDEWEQKVTVRADGIDLANVGRPTILRHRSGATEYDTYGNVTKAEAETEGGVYEQRHKDGGALPFF